MDNASKMVPVVVSLILVFGLAIGIFVFLNKEATTLPDTMGVDINSLEEESNMTNVQDFEQLEINTLKEGSGDEVVSGKLVSVHYEGTLSDGTVFDSSYNRGTPFEFTLGQNMVIQGWEQGVLGMKVGEVRELRIPSSLGYGQQGSGPIPGGAGLIFKVELLEIK